MTEIGCFFSSQGHRPRNFTFVKYQEFMKISLCNKSIIIRIENLKRNETIFRFYILSLLCTEDPTRISIIDVVRGIEIFGISTDILRNRSTFVGSYDYIMLEKRCFKNPLLSQEPRRETSMKKQNKFMKLIHQLFYRRVNPRRAIDLYQKQMIANTDVMKIVEYEKRINLLCSIRGFNRDIYLTIRNFL